MTHIFQVISDRSSTHSDIGAPVVAFSASGPNEMESKTSET